LFFLSQQRDAVLSNPLKMERIRQKITNDLEDYQFQKDMKKKAKKELKHQRKEEKKKKKEQKKEKKHKKDKKREEEERIERKDCDSESRSSSDDEDSERGSLKESEHPTGDFLRKRSRSPSADRRYNGERDRNFSGERNDYGLQRRNDYRDRRSSDEDRKDYLGPRPDLLRKKELEQKQSVYKRQKTEVQKLSEEEKARRLAEMEKDAMVNDQQRASRHSSASLTSSSANNPSDEQGLVVNNGTGAFLQSMRNEAYKQAAHNGLKDRLDQNRNYRQSSFEMEDNQNFLKR
jgi:hypothetical protein